MSVTPTSPVKRLFSGLKLSYFEVLEHLDPLARQNLTHHVRAAFYEGIFAGGCANALNLVCKKFGDATNTQIKWLFVANSIGMFVAVLIPMILRGVGKVRQSVLLVTLRNCVVLVIPALYFLTVTDLTGLTPGPDSQFTFWFILLTCIAVVLVIAPVTSRAGLSMEMYPDSHRMQCLGSCAQVQILTMVLSSFITAPLLDQHPSWFWWLFPAFALASFIGLTHYRAMRSPVEASGKTRFLSFTLLDILRGPLRNRHFIMYQLVFSLGGLPNLMVMPLYFLFNSDRAVCNLSYHEFAWLFVIASLTNFLTVHRWAKVLDKFNNPFVGRGILMVVWTFHPLVFSLAAILYAAFTPLDPSTRNLVLSLVFLTAFLGGTLEAGGSLNWLLGSTYFAPEGQAAMYSGAHMIFNATRAFFGPLLGMSLYEYFEAALTIHPWNLNLFGHEVVIHQGFLPLFLIATAMMFMAAVFQFVLRWHYGPMSAPGHFENENSEKVGEVVAAQGPAGVGGSAGVLAGTGVSGRGGSPSQRLPAQPFTPGGSH